MLKMWGHISSINVCKVIYASQDLALPFERVDAGSEFGSLKAGLPHEEPKRSGTAAAYRQRWSDTQRSRPAACGVFDFPLS